MKSLALLLALAAGSPQSSDEPLTLRFGWPEAGAVRVRESALRKGANSESSYVLRWEPATEGEGRILRFTGLSFSSFAGLPADDPRVADAIRTATVLGSAVPELRISDAGYLVELSGYQDVVLELISLYAEFIEPPIWERIRPILESPATYAATEVRLVETWNTWVANWIDLEVERGTTEVWKFDLEETGGAVPELRVEFGATTEFRGVDCVEILTTAIADEELLLRLTLGQLGLLAEETDQEIPDTSPFDRMSRVRKSHGYYAVDGLRPIEVETTMELRAWQLDALEPMLEVEQHRYVFEWDDLEPPAPTPRPAPAEPTD